MGFRAYSRLLADRRLRVIYVAGFFARIPNMAIPLVLTLLVVEQLDGSYAQAGLVAAAETVGAALGGPWRGRLIDRWGLRRAIMPSIVAVALLYPAMAFASYAVLLPLAFLAGVFLVPVFSIVRLALAAAEEDPDRRRTVFALDAAVAECSFLIGPALGAVVATSASPAIAIAVVGLCEGLAGLLFWYVNPPMRSETTSEAPTPATTGRWMSGQLLFLYLISGGAVAALMATDLGIVAELRDLGEVGAIGWVFLGWGGSSLVGGLVYGAMKNPIRPTHLVLAMGLLTIPIGLADSVWTLALLSIPAGLLCAPVMTASAEWITRLAPEDRRGEAMGWQGTAFTTGAAVASPIIGGAIDLGGPSAGFALGGAVAVLIALLSYGGQAVVARALDLRAAGSPR